MKDNFKTIRVDPETFERLKWYRLTAHCVKRYGRLGRPPKIFELASILLDEKLKERKA